MYDYQFRMAFYYGLVSQRGPFRESQKDLLRLTTPYTVAYPGGISYQKRSTLLLPGSRGAGGEAGESVNNGSINGIVQTAGLTENMVSQWLETVASPAFRTGADGLGKTGLYQAAEVYQRIKQSKMFDYALPAYRYLNERFENIRSQLMPQDFVNLNFLINTRSFSQEVVQEMQLKDILIETYIREGQSPEEALKRAIAVRPQFVADYIFYKEGNQVLPNRLTELPPNNDGSVLRYGHLFTKEQVANMEYLSQTVWSYISRFNSYKTTIDTVMRRYDVPDTEKSLFYIWTDYDNLDYNGSAWPADPPSTPSLQTNELLMSNQVSPTTPTGFGVPANPATNPELQSPPTSLTTGIDVQTTALTPGFGIPANPATNPGIAFNEPTALTPGFGIPANPATHIPLPPTKKSGFGVPLNPVVAPTYSKKGWGVPTSAVDLLPIEADRIIGVPTAIGTTE